MTRIAVVSVARSDYGVYRPLLRRIEASASLELALIASAMHLCPEFGNSIEEIRADGFAIAAEVDLSLGADRPGSIARSMGLGTIGFAQAYEALQPDLLIVLGDRFEMHAAAVAALPFLIPIVHLAGGALTGGAIDDSLRHSMTKLASLHFVENETYAGRVIQMGEDPARVHVTGALGLDNLGDLALLSLDELNRRFDLGLSPGAAPLVVTFHPVTREFEATATYIDALLAALRRVERPVVFTYPNADTNGRVIIDAIQRFLETAPSARAVAHLGTQGYFSLMRHAAAMVGNSSSGIIEAASFKLPVVNIGTRQEGRLAPANVIHTGYREEEIVEGVRKATSRDFGASLQDLANPYGDGRAAERMVEVLQHLDPNDTSLIRKGFHDLPGRRA